MACSLFCSFALSILFFIVLVFSFKSIPVPLEYFSNISLLICTFLRFFLFATNKNNYIVDYKFITSFILLVCYTHAYIITNN